MCFSATTASFIAGVSLSVLGVATVKKAERKAEIPFAMIPLLFGAQQIVEGLLWLSFRFDAPRAAQCDHDVRVYVVLARAVANICAILNRLDGKRSLAQKDDIGIPDHRDRGRPVPSVLYSQVSCHFRTSWA